MKKLSKKSAPKVANPSVTKGTAMTSVQDELTSNTTAQRRNLDNTKYEMGQSYSFSPKKSGLNKSSSMRYEVGQSYSFSPSQKSTTSKVSNTKNEIGSFVSTTGSKPENLYQSKYEMGKIGTSKSITTPKVSTQSSSTGSQNFESKLPTPASKYEIGRMEASKSIGKSKVSTQQSSKYEIGSQGSSKMSESQSGSSGSHTTTSSPHKTSKTKSETGSSSSSSSKHSSR